MSAEGDNEVTLGKAYITADTDLRVKTVRLGILLYLVLMPAFGLLDWIVYPEKFWQLITIRMKIGLVFICLYFLTKTNLVRKIKIIGVITAILAGLPLSWMVMITEGTASPYYAGLNLVIVVMSVLLPWRMLETLLVCLLTVGIYTLGCVASYYYFDNQFSFSEYFNNIYFVVATSIICVLASYYQSRQRFDNFRLNFELNAKNAELAQLDAMKSQFFANISHELRTPLTLILGPIQDLLKSPSKLTDEVASMMYMARENGLRLLKLVNDLLDIIRFEDTESVVELQPVQIKLFLSGLTDSVRHLAESRDLQIEIVDFDEDVVISGNQAALERVFLNLYSNAIKFTPSGGTIKISCSCRNGVVGLVFSDTGIGIKKSEIPFVFDRFHQVDSSTTRKYTGTGLGLSLVKELMDKMQGEISIESELGTGTKIHLNFLRWKGDISSRALDELSAQDSLENLHQMAAYHGVAVMEEPMDSVVQDVSDNKASVIVVDDEPSMRKYLTGILSSQYQIIECDNGRDALNQARQWLPDIMVVDLMLPEVDGLEICRILKEDPATTMIKIVLLTARVDDEAKLVALKNGADDFLTKPFSQLELETRLSNLLKAGKLEKDLLQQNISLGDALTELKATQGQLIHSEKLNALGNLAAGLLHEVNNPLNYSMTAIQMLKMEKSYKQDELFTEVVNDIEEGMSRIKAIVTDLRSFAYPSEAERQIPFSIKDAIESALRFTASDLKSIDIVHRYCNVEEVLGSQSHIVQILINLLSNAAKAIEPIQNQREGRIEIETQKLNQRLVIIVTDNGIGMNDQTKAHIFEPFFTTRDVGEGVGMGLSICHTIAQNHQGQLSVESDLDKGTSFTFDLPLIGH